MMKNRSLTVGGFLAIAALAISLTPASASDQVYGGKFTLHCKAVNSCFFSKNFPRPCIEAA